ncbi:MAG: hypothetical protein IT490_14160 [Candidatus Contendobacter sp.]|nr:hypothetical protein [Candidatus Contendobacter sp.]
MKPESSNTEPGPAATPVIALICGTWEHMAVDVEDALTVLDDADSSESARSLAMSTMSLVPMALRFYVDVLSGVTPITEGSFNE